MSGPARSRAAGGRRFNRGGDLARAADVHTPVEAARAGLGRAGRPGRLDGSQAHVPRRARRDLVGRRREAGRMGTGQRPAPGRRHRRPGHPAGQGHLIPGHQPACPGGPREPGSPHPAATLVEITRIYAIRNWTGQSYKQVKDELGWADFQVCSQVLVNCAFSFCWDTWFARRRRPPRRRRQAPATERGAQARQAVPAACWPRALRAVRAWLARGSRCNAGGPHGPRHPRHCRP